MYRSFSMSLVTLFVLATVGCGGNGSARRTDSDAGTMPDDCGTILIPHRVEVFPPRGAETSTFRQDIDFIGPTAAVVAVNLKIYLNSGRGWELYASVQRDFRDGSGLQTQFLRCIQNTRDYIVPFTLALHRPRDPRTRVAFRGTIDTIDQNNLQIGGESDTGEVRCAHDLPFECGRGTCNGRLLTFSTNIDGQTAQVCAYELPWSPI